MKCPKCGFDNPDIASYCINCGARVDGKILCPKCGKPISPDEVKCPHCGKKIPHQHEGDDLIQQTPPNRVNLFNKVFLIIIIALLGLSIVASFGQYVRSNNASTPWDFGFSWDYLFNRWSVISDTLSSTNDQVKISVSYLKVIIPFVIVVFNISICLVFGLLGLVKSIKALIAKGDKVCTSYKFLAVTMCSNLFGSNLLLAMQQDNSSNKFDISFMMKTFLWACAAAFATMMIIHIFLDSERKRGPVLVEKIIFGCSFFVGLYIVNQIGNYAFFTSEENSRLYSLFEKCLSQLSSFTTTKTNEINQVILSASNYVFVWLNGAIISSLIIFISVAFFSKRERNMMYKIPCFVLSFLVLLNATISLILTIVISIMFNVEINNISYFPGSCFINSFIGANILFGCSMACLKISKSYRNYLRLVAQTTKN